MNNEIEQLISQHRLNAKLELIIAIQKQFPLNIALHAFLDKKKKEEILLVEANEILNPIKL